VQAVKRRHRLILAGLAILLPFLTAAPARAGYQPPPVTCPPGSSCYISVFSHVHVGGSGAGGSGAPIPIQPPTCAWDPVGNSQTGSKYLVGYYNGVAPASSAPNDQFASFTQAQQMIASNSTEPGEWYFRPNEPNESAAVQAECATEPLWFFAVPGEPLPGSNVAAVTLGQLATAKLKIPGVGLMYLNPVNGPLYSNLPTFVRVAFKGAFRIGPGGDPYVTDTAAVEGEAATVWVIANPLQLTTSDPTATLYTGGCGYLGSTDMVLKAGQVASTGANGTADCGVTFHQPGPWVITATLTWRTCWVPEVEYGPPPAAADCTPVPGADLTPDVWHHNVNVHEIQTANGSGN
jgi:hypothetical protein